MITNDVQRHISVYESTTEPEWRAFHASIIRALAARSALATRYTVVLDWNEKQTQLYTEWKGRLDACQTAEEEMAVQEERRVMWEDRMARFYGATTEEYAAFTDAELLDIDNMPSWLCKSYDGGLPANATLKGLGRR